MREGAYATGVRGVIPTVTYPSHATLVTGVSPAIHGIHSNTTFDPLPKNQGGWYWYASDIKDDRRCGTSLRNAPDTAATCTGP